jgi:hypothetical protein
MPGDLRVTSVRFRRLKSSSVGYHHTALEAEASVPSDRAANDVLEDLIAWIDERLGIEDRVDESRGRLERLIGEEHRLTRTVELLRADVERNRQIIEKYEVLGELARERGIGGAKELGDEQPF